VEKTKQAIEMFNVLRHKEKIVAALHITC